MITIQATPFCTNNGWSLQISRKEIDWNPAAIANSCTNVMTAATSATTASTTNNSNNAIVVNYYPQEISPFSPTSFSSPSSSLPSSSVPSSSPPCFLHNKIINSENLIHLYQLPAAAPQVFMVVENQEPRLISNQQLNLQNSSNVDVYQVETYQTIRGDHDRHRNQEPNVNYIQTPFAATGDGERHVNGICTNVSLQSSMKPLPFIVPQENTTTFRVEKKRSVSEHQTSFQQLRTEVGNQKELLSKCFTSAYLARKYACPVCHKKFKDKRGINEHMRYHFEERPFECKECGKRYYQPTHLKEHKRVHSGEKPYKCFICKKQFRHATNFSRHKRNFHELNK